MSQLPYKVWVAQYNSSVTYKGSYIMWQYTSTGKINGISGVVDKSHSYYALGNAKPMTPTTTTTTTTTKPTLKSIEAIAKEVIDGKWGSGEERKKKLTAAGYNYEAVQKKVNELIQASIPVRFQKANQWAINIANSGKYRYKGDVDDNYLYYSGLMYRIIEVDKDNNVRAISEESVTLMYPGFDKGYNDSYINKWLNLSDKEYSGIFEKTLYNTDKYLSNNYYCSNTVDDIENIKCEETIDYKISLH